MLSVLSALLLSVFPTSYFLPTQLRERKVNLVSLKDGLDLSTPAGRLMANVLASVAQYETEVRGERVRAFSGDPAMDCRFRNNGQAAPHPAENLRPDPLWSTLIRVVREGRDSMHLERISADVARIAESVAPRGAAR